MLQLSRNGYTAAQVDAALHSSTRTMHFRYDLLDKNNTFKKTLTTVTSGHVGYDTSQKIRRTAKFTMQDDSTVNFLSDRIQPHALLLMPDASYPTKLTHDETTQSDFLSGTLSNVRATSSGLQLNTLSSSNIALNCTYSKSQQPTTNYPDTNNAEFTNGNITESYSSGEGFGYQATTFGLSTGQTATLDIVVDLGSNRWLKECVLHSGGGSDGSSYGTDGYRADSVEILTSTDNVNFTSQGTSSTFINTWELHVSMFVQARYIKFRITKTFGASSSGNDWLFIIEGQAIEANYPGNGSRTTNPIDLSVLGTIQSSNINWTDNTPANTTVGLQVSTDNGTTWNNLTNGSSLIANGSKYSSVLIKENLSTTDTSQTPTLNSVSVTVKGSIPGGWVDFPLGVFILSTPPRVTDPAQVITRQIDAYDLLQVLVDDKVATRYTVTSGTNYITAIQSILTGAGINQYNLTATASTLPNTLDWAPGTEKLQIINDLLTAINYRSLWFDENGQAQAIPYQSPSVRAPEYTYIDDSKSVMFPDMTQSLDLFAIPNEWVLTVTEPDRSVITSTYTNTNPNSPTSTVNRGRTIVKLDNTQQAPDQATLDSIASKMAYTDSQVYEAVEFGTAIQPFHSDNDVFNLTYSVLGITYKVSETAWSFNLVQGDRMIHKVSNVVSV